MKLSLASQSIVLGLATAAGLVEYSGAEHMWIPSSMLSTWVHVAVVRSAGSMLVYRNFQLYETVTISSASVVVPSVLMSVGSHFVGTLDQFVYTPSKASSDDIQQLQYCNKILVSETRGLLSSSRKHPDLDLIDPTLLCLCVSDDACCILTRAGPRCPSASWRIKETARSVMHKRFTMGRTACDWTAVPPWRQA